MSNATSVSKQDVLACQEIVKNFRTTELITLLSHFNFPYVGKREDLINRSKAILLNSAYQANVVQKIQQIQGARTSGSAQMRARSVLPPTVSRNVAQPAVTMSSNVSLDALIRKQQNLMQQAGTGQSNNQPRIVMLPTNPQSGNQSANIRHFTYSNPFPFNTPMHVPPSFSTIHPLPNIFRPPPPPAAFTSGNPVPQLRTLNLPFYDVKSIIVPLMELQSFPSPTRPGGAKSEGVFAIPSDDIDKVNYRGDDRPLPRYEIQLRMFLLDTSAEQPDDFPPGCIVKVDGYNVNLPNIIPTNKPNAEQKRLSRPVNLTPYCHPPRGRERPHRLVIEWNGDKRAWAFGIFIVHRVNSQTLQERILLNVNAKRPFDTTKNTIIRRLRGTDDDDGIEMDTLKISLLCPLMRTPIKIPVRAADCTHLQSFDLTNYLMMCEKRPVWKCPVCDNNATYSKLIIDEYFQTLLKAVGPSVEDVELLKDGTWRIMKEELMSISDDENKDIVIASTSKIVKKAAAPKEPEKAAGPASKAQDSDEVIVLSDSDDDFPSNFNAIRVESGLSSISLESQGRKSPSLPTYLNDGTEDSHNGPLLPPPPPPPILPAPMPLPSARVCAPTTIPNLSSVRSTNPPVIPPVLPTVPNLTLLNTRQLGPNFDRPRAGPNEAQKNLTSFLDDLTSNEANSALRTNVETQSATGNTMQKDSAPQFSSINDSNSASLNIVDCEPVACRQEFDLHEAQKKVANELVAFLQTLRHNN